MTYHNDARYHCRLCNRPVRSDYATENGQIFHEFCLARRDEIVTLRRENRELRVLLAVRVSGPTLYTDDGELSDCSEWSHIDYKRDTPEQIERALQQRAHRAAFEDTQPMVRRQSGTDAK